MSSDTDKLRTIWCSILLDAVNLRFGGGYVLLRSVGLVGIGVFVFVKNSDVGNIRCVDGKTQKVSIICIFSLFFSPLFLSFFLSFFIFPHLELIRLSIYLFYFLKKNLI